MNYSQETEQLQNQLAQAYDQQRGRYEAAATVAKEISSVANNGAVPEDMLLQMSDLMHEIETADQQIDPHRTQWDAMGISANAQLKNSVNQLRTTIQSVMEAVADAETKAREAKHRLAPHLSSATTGRRMVQAYGSAKASGSRASG